MTTVKVKKASDGVTVTLKSSNTDDFNFAIGTLKSFIHSSARSYDPEARQWHVDAAAEVEFERWITNLRTVIAATIEWSKEADSQSSKNKRASNGQQQWPPPRYRKQPTREELCACLFLLPDASDELIKAAYKCLAMKFHPDKQGGDEEKMKRISDAYQRLLAA